jgi:Ca2+-binding EF-hand superfamily protein
LAALKLEALKAKMRPAFDRLDVDRDGRLDPEEFAFILTCQRGSKPLSDAEAAKIYSEVDTDSGTSFFLLILTVPDSNSSLCHPGSTATLN